MRAVKRESRHTLPACFFDVADAYEGGIPHGDKIDAI